ncbi:MAG: hypothetical protein WBP61_02915 [Nocardioides sp.]
MATPTSPRRCPAWVPVLIILLTVAQLAVAQWWPGIDRFADKAFGARLLAYPLLMLIAPVVWWLVNRHRQPRPAPPYGAFSLVMVPFLIDVTGNSLDLYDSLVWWDDLNHFVNWLLLLTGIGLLLCTAVRPPWAVVIVVCGLGAILAIGWEIGEWWTFIRHGTEIETAYEDTLGDEVLGTLGALCAGFVVLATVRHRERRAA